NTAPVQGPPSPYDPVPSDKPSLVEKESNSVFKRVREWQQDKLVWETGAGLSYFLPAGEILTYEFFLNLFDRHFVEPTSDYETNGDTIWHNLTDGKWVIDNDQFKVNQFLHPYGGSIYYGLARSAGLNFWESFLYSVAGSFIWEIAGETTNPSINDMIATPIGGTFLGEPFFRMASLLLEDSEGQPGFWRELGAAVISPPMGFNRLVFGDKFDAVFPSYRPATFMRLQAGGTISSSSQNVSSSVEEAGAVADFTFSYGLPGKPGYSYRRPFDYFDFHLTAVTANVLESVNTRGLLLGTTYASGNSTRGIWGLYGSYDYISPQVFRVSSTALSLGTTWQSWLSEPVALQGTFLGGVGYGAAGNIERTGERDYHYGVTPQGLLSLRFIFGDRAMIDLTGHEFYVSSALASEQGWENIARGDSSLTLRVYNRHGVAVRYSISHRDAKYPAIEYKDQTVGMVSLMYVFLGETGFGAVDWR
ncbi:MAG TPA: DUF3943 domain-containing protein, partial [Nitrospiraceae bacterium]